MFSGIDVLLHGMVLPMSCYGPQHIFCPCLFGPNYKRNKIMYSDIVQALQIITDQVVSDIQGALVSETPFSFQFLPFSGD